MRKRQPARFNKKHPTPLLTYTSIQNPPNYDLPVTYNKKVRNWIRYFQGDGRKWFKRWLERSHRYLPEMKKILDRKSLPTDLAYVAMIESGFSPRAVSSAQAVGYWQFIQSTANRYGLLTKWWIDERRDYRKSTWAAANYLSDLYGMFRSWYLAAAAYNMGEGRLRRLIKKYETRNYWELAQKPRFPKETRDYIPKLIAAMMISKAPRLYGFEDITPHKRMDYEHFFVPGGTDLKNLARFTGLPHKVLKRLNPELIRGFVPKTVNNHRIRIPKGSLPKVSQFIRRSHLQSTM
jgi:membrane-bound lytic murein transglycosylase D